MSAGDPELRPGVRLVADRTYPAAFTLEVNDTDQSYVDLDDPLRLEFDYIQRIADALDAHAAAGERLRVVHVGGAGLTLPRYLSVTRPQSAQIVLEPDAELTDFVREHLPLPKRSGVKVRPIDGRAGLAEMRDDYADVIIIDAFAGAQVPPELTTREFLADVHRVLVSNGTVMINITDHAPFGYLKRCVAGVQELFAEVLVSAEPATLKGRRFGNVLILGTRGQLAVADLTRKAASSAFPYRIVRGLPLEQLIGHARPFTEADSAPSPPPPTGPTSFR